MYKAPPPEVSSEQFYETDPAKPYRRGFAIQNVSPLPITWAEHVAAQGHWGAALREYMARLRALGLPGRAVRVPAPARQPGHPRRRERPVRPAGRPVRLLPVRQRPDCSRTPRRTSWSRSCARPAPTEVITIQRYAHLVGGARMAADESSGVVDRGLPQFRRAQPVHHRRQRAADPGQRQPGADHHGPRCPRRRPDGHRPVTKTSRRGANRYG